MFSKQVKMKGGDILNSFLAEASKMNFSPESLTETMTIYLETE